MEIGNRLKNARVEMGLTQEKVAEEIGVSRQTVYNWENGKCYPDIENVIKLSDLYSVSLDELLKEDKKMIGHLKESTDVVESRRKLTLIILTLCSWIFWTGGFLAYLIFVLTKSSMGILEHDRLRRVSDTIYFIAYPLCMLVITFFMGLFKDFGKWRWLYIPITAAMFVVAGRLTVWVDAYFDDKLVWDLPEGVAWSLVKHLSARQEWWLMLGLGFVCSAVGMWIGAFIRHAVYYVRSRKEKET